MRAMATPSEHLPAPGVRLGPDFAARLGALPRNLLRARGRLGSAAAAAGWGRGSEFDGHRPYRPGDDLRELDWTLLARCDEPQVRRRRPEGGETWALWVDTSASMGLGGEAGEFGKLQRAAEIALGLAALGIEAGARVHLLAAATDAPAAAVRLQRRTDLARAWSWAAGLRAGGAGLAELAARPGAAAGAQRLFWIGDLFDVRPARLLALARPGLAIGVVRVLAPEELAPPRTGRVRWLDVEGDAHRTVDLARSAASYGQALGAELDAWRRSAARARARIVVASSAAPFERAVLALLGPWR